MVTYLIRSLVLSGLLTLFAFQYLFSQVVFREVSDYKIHMTDSLFFDLSETRSIILLNGKWSVQPADDEKAQKVTVSVPSIFEGEDELVFEKEFELSKAQISKNTLEIVFFSINYTADISLNNTIIYRHSGGEYPFKITLPRDILRSDRKNVLSLKMVYELNSKNSIPQNQRFLFPKNHGGIIGDVYIHLKPDFYIAKEKIKTTFSADYKNVSLEIESIIKNNMSTVNFSGNDNSNEYSLIISITDAAGNTLEDLPAYNFTLDKNKDVTITQKLDLSGAVLWTPETPFSYILKQQLFKEDSLVDIKQKPVALFNLKSDTESIKLNGSDFILKGTTYYPTNNEYGRLLSYAQMENDITLIKDAGFNCVRFANATIHPYYLQLCQVHGLFAFIEVPISGVPSGIAEDQSFISRGKDFLFNYISFYGDYPSLTAIGLGESYLPDMEAHVSLISSLAASVKEKSNLLTYASFFGKDLVKIENLDLYGIEFFKGNVSSLDATINELQTEFGKGKIFISSATYPVNIGGSDGYVNDYSFEAQAKFFEEFLTFTAQNKTAAFFLNTFIDYRGDYSSFICGHNENNLYQLGLIDENRSRNRIGYKVVFAKLNNLEKVTIPIGSKKDDSPMIFIVFGLLIAIFMGVLVNSGRKFREDASRALLRPYNFFSDVRDQRIISASHSTLLGLIIAAVVALIVSNILFHLKTDLVFEHLLIAFASPLLMKTVNYLSWHPFMSLVWLTAFNIVLFVIIALVIKIASMFISTKVYIISVYFTFIWALLPVVLLIPVGIILYRVLLDSSINIYIYLGLGLVILWILYRLMKGIHVLFDTNPGTIYFYSTVFLLALIGSILFYFELKHSTLQYLLFTLKQFNIM